MSPEEFWRWFGANRADLVGVVEDERVLGELDANVARLGDVVWELGFHDGRQYIAISPVGSTADAERIVAAAPSFRDWDVRLFKPPRTWELKFTIDEAPTEIDGTRWEVVCYRYEDLKSEIVLKPQDDLDPASETARDVALTIVDGELGEAARREYVLDIELVSTWSPEQRRDAARLRPGLLAELVLPKAS